MQSGAESKAPAITADQLAALSPAAGDATRDANAEAKKDNRPQTETTKTETPKTEPKTAIATPVAKTAKAASLSQPDYKPDFNMEAFLNSQKTSQPLSERIQKDPNLPPMIKDVETQAFNGLSSAQHDLGVVYSAGHAGVGIDYQKSFAWFKESAFDNVPNARYNLGVLYHQGLGVTQDTDLAINWYRAAAELDHPDALYNLGIANIEGIGMAYAPQDAVYYFEKAAAQGIMEASYNLGLIYENGLLGESDLDQAIYWYKVATDQKSIEGQNALEELTARLGYNQEDINRLLNKFERKTTISESRETQSSNTTKIIPVKTSGLRQNDKVAPAHNDTGYVSFDNSTAQDNSIMIAQIQEQLMGMGYYPGPANGITDERTEDAIISYQSSSGHNYL
jgi:TPR repeat protein